MFIRFAPKAAVAALSLALLTACGDASAAQPAETPTPKGQERQYQIQAIIADCMKQKGFRYVPYVPPRRQKSEEELKRESGDYAAMKEFREKYGFGVWASLVYPKEFGNPAVKPDGNPPVDPNWEIQSSLSEAQRKAYGEAYDACNAKAVKEVTGTEVTGSVFQMGEQINKRIAQLKARELDGDPRARRPRRPDGELPERQGVPGPVGHAVGPRRPRRKAVPRRDEPHRPGAAECAVR